MKGHFERALMHNRVEAALLGGARRVEVGAATLLLHPTLPATNWNFAVDFDAEPEEFPRLMRRIEEEFKGASRFPSVLTGPYDQPRDIAERLEAMGYHAEPTRTIMYVEEKPDIEVKAPDGLELELADEGTADECVQIALQRFGWPREWGKPLRRAAVAGMARGPNHFRLYYAALNGAGVATAYLVFSAAAAGLYGMATSKDFEGQGIGRALLAHCAKDAFARGVDQMTLQVPTGSKAEGFYESAGFKKAYIARRWLRKKREGGTARAEEE